MAKVLKIVFSVIGAIVVIGVVGIFVLLAALNPDYTYSAVSYGDVVFATEYDGLMHTDQLRLYDNGFFKLEMPDVNSNGVYRIKGDTVFLGHFLYDGPYYHGFVSEGGFVRELVRTKSGLVGRSTRDTSMGVYLDELSAS